MPQKTKEKTATEQRVAFQYTIREPVAEEKIDSAPVKKVPYKLQFEPLEEKHTLSRYFFFDFRRSLVFIVVILAIEFALYFLKQTNYFP